MAQDKDASACDAALEDLCQSYWYPLYAYVRRRGYSMEEAQDLTQEFFFRLTSKDYLRSADREKGKFRTFLLVAIKYFLANEWHRANAQKRGGGRIIVPIDQGWAEDTYHVEPVDDVTPESLFERRWALLLLERALSAVENDMASANKKVLFDGLKHTLTGASGGDTYSKIAAELDMTENAVKAAAHRMRGRFRSHLRTAIEETVSSKEEVEEEIQHLFKVFSK
jgi:RNA polymerase sigma-70 factor (ECF subfamily)